MESEMHRCNGSFLTISLLLFLLICSPGTAFSQSLSCQSDAAMQQLFKENAGAANSWQSFLHQARNQKSNTQGCTQSYIIPTVVHVFHEEGQNAIPLSQIQSALDHANQDFQGLNPDYDDVNPIFRNIRGTIDVTFALATLDPEGNPTSGVQYYPEKSGLGNGAHHPDIAQYAWDNYSYLNIYVLSDLFGDCNKDQAGITWWPDVGMSDSSTARIVFNYQYLGDHGSSIADTEFQSVFTHELGHWLGLSHTFANGCSGDGDGIADTPPTEGLSGCDPNATSCGNIVNRENYMAFSTCYRMFTKGQVSRMNTVLNQHPARRPLWQFDNLEATGTITHYEGSDLVAEFSIGSTTIDAGESLCFSDLSCGFPTSWQWTFSGTDTLISTEANPCITLCEPGRVTATLVVTNESGTSAPFQMEITVLPPPQLQASFVASDTAMIAGTAVILSDFSQGNPDTWNWTFEGGSPSFSAEQNPTSIFNFPGRYTIQLETTNCMGEVDSMSMNITVLSYDPTPFGCKPAFYQTINANSSLLQYDASNVDVGFNWIADFGYQVNATAYNPLDNYIYTIQRFGIPNLIRVHADGSMIDLGDINGLPGNVYVGDITSSGEYYIKNGGITVYKVDIATLQVTSFNTNINFAAADWAYRKHDNTLYGGGGNGYLYALNLDTRTVTANPVTGLPGGTYGAAFITDDGALFLAENGSGFIFKVDIENLTAQFIANGPSTGLNDGCSCPNAPSPFVAHIFSKNDSICVQTNGFAGVNVLSNDEAYLNDIDPTSLEILTPPSYGNIHYDSLTGTITYRSDGVPQADFLVYAICGDNRKYPACDTAKVYFLPPDVSTTSATICEGEIFILGDEVYTEPGTYTYTFTNQFGCDSIVTLNLEVYKLKAKKEEVNICEGESYYFEGETYTETGVYQELRQTDKGCQQTNTLILHVYPHHFHPIASGNLSRRSIRGWRFCFYGQWKLYHAPGDPLWL
jgi:PKD repeat protein